MFLAQAVDRSTLESARKSHSRICRKSTGPEGYDERHFTTSFHRHRRGRFGDPADRVFGPCADRLANQAIKIIAGYPAGGQTDLFARTYGEYIRSETGQNVTVENKAGASGSSRRLKPSAPRPTATR